MTTVYIAYEYDYMTEEEDICHIADDEDVADQIAEALAYIEKGNSEFDGRRVSKSYRVEEMNTCSSFPPSLQQELEEVA